jgi:hypothetical protein
MNAMATGRTQFVDLRIIELILGRNAGIANQFLGEGRRTELCCFSHRFFDPPLVLFVQIRNAYEKDPLQARFLMKNRDYHRGRQMPVSRLLWWKSHK